MIIKKQYKIMALGVGLSALALHFILLAIYANPLGQARNRISFLAYNYSYPFFHQNWNLFAPAPDCNYSLLAMYDDQGPKVLDVFSEIVQKHQANRLGGHEPLVLAFSNSIHYFEKNSPGQQALNGPVKNDLNFTILERAVKGYLKETRQLGQIPVRLFLVVDNIHTQQRRVYFNN
jgi:hypothetical protein